MDPHCTKARTFSSLAQCQTAISAPFNAPPSCHFGFQGFALRMLLVHPTAISAPFKLSSWLSWNSSKGLSPPHHPWIILRAHMDPPPYAMALDIIAPKQGHFLSNPMQTFYFSTIHHPGLQGFALVCGCLFAQCLQLVEINPRVFEPVAWGGGCSNNPWVVWRSETLGLISTGCRHWVKKHAQRMTAWRGAEWCWRDDMRLFLLSCSDVECHGMGKWALK